MLFFLVSLFPFAVLVSKSLPMQALPPWAGEVGVLSFLFWKGLISPLLHLFDKCRPIATRKIGASPSPMPQRRRCAIMAAENAEEAQEMSILDLPELALESILEKLPPAGLSAMEAVCTSLRERCRSDHLWEMHMEEKWGKVIGPVACRERKLQLASNNSSLLGFRINGGHWIGLLISCVWPISWLKERIESCNRSRNPLPDGTLMSWYQSLESGKYWFPAQVYNREHAHVGFMLSCYDAQVSYDCKTDTFSARYPPHGQRNPVEEKGIEWNRLRAPPVDTCADELHISDCLSDLRPGDHIEIQWRRSKKFPYGWWYGVIGHLEPCDGNELFCRCHLNDTVVLEFNQYTAGSRWRQTSINRKYHKEEGNEADGFYGGIRKLRGKDEISKWRELWPTDVLE